MDLKLQSCSRADAERVGQGQARRRRWKAEQWSFRWDGVDVRVKDVRYSSPLYRWTLGRLLIRHEAAIYRRLRGVRFAPRFFGMLDPDALLLEDVLALPLGKFRRRQITPPFFARVEDCLRELHAMGLVHLDIRSRRNILLTSGEEPILIDFANALYVGTNWFSRRFLLPPLAAIDRSAVLKFLHDDFPELMSRSQRERYNFFRRFHRLWFFGRLWQRVRSAAPRLTATARVTQRQTESAVAEGPSVQLASGVPQREASAARGEPFLS